MDIYKKILQESGRKKLALLIDPDKCNRKSIKKRLEIANNCKVDFIFVGGSLLNYDLMDKCIVAIKSLTKIPIIIFPGNGMHISPKADAILFLSLISGRNADLLIGNHVHSAPIIKKFNLEAIPTGYMIMESGHITTAQYVSNSIPLPRSKPDVAVSTAIAGEMLGLKAIYIDAGSGAENPVPSEIITAVKKNINIPLIIGGGIRTPEAAKTATAAGADIIVIGNAAEENPELLTLIKNSI
ncbi:MAG: geranylgeranylglyceryl/heptaprenylglyceryl phosphate synthase [Bacteroidetes bacterium CG2_30_33_31]|nr:MAG: geranylgeranylglyceryl/heptaprenylglyceryl phosphate synthase [Bacteroidetes bacterium CG2_30_33_31]